MIKKIFVYLMGVLGVFVVVYANIQISNNEKKYDIELNSLEIISGEKEYFVIDKGGIYIDKSILKTGESFEGKNLLIGTGGELLVDYGGIQEVDEDFGHIYYDKSEINDLVSSGRIAYNWGNHEEQGYIKKEEDPVYQEESGNYYKISQIGSSIIKGQEIESWGDHTEKYIKGDVEQDNVYEEEKKDYYDKNQADANIYMEDMGENRLAKVSGRMLVDGKIKEEENHVKFEDMVNIEGGLMLKESNEECNEENEGLLQYKDKKVYVCNGIEYKQIKYKPCGLDYYYSGDAGTCLFVGTGWYSEFGKNERYECTSGGVYAIYTSAGGGKDECEFTCGTDYYLTGGICEFVGTGWYFDVQDQIKKECTNGPEDVVYQTAGGGENNCSYLSINNSSESLKLYPGDYVGYNIRIGNGGSYNANGVLVNHILGRFLQYTSSALDTGAGFVQQNPRIGDGITWSGFDILGNTTGTIVLTAQVQENVYDQSNDTFITKEFRESDPTDQEIINRTFGNDTDSSTAYTRKWSYNTGTCGPFTVTHVYPEDVYYNFSDIGSNEIYVLHSGSYNSHGFDMNNCSAVLGSGNVVFYTKGDSYSNIYVKDKNYIIIDGIRIDGTNEPDGSTNGANDHGIVFEDASNTTVNNCEIMETEKAISYNTRQYNHGGTYYLQYNQVSNSKIYNNGYGIYYYAGTNSRGKGRMRYNIVNNSQFFGNNYGIIYYANSWGGSAGSMSLFKYNTINNSVFYNNNIGLWYRSRADRGRSYIQYNTISNSVFYNNTYGLKSSLDGDSPSYSYQEGNKMLIENNRLYNSIFYNNNYAFYQDTPFIEDNGYDCRRVRSNTLLLSDNNKYYGYLKLFANNNDFWYSHFNWHSDLTDCFETHGYTHGEWIAGSQGDTYIPGVRSGGILYTGGESMSCDWVVNPYNSNGNTYYTTESCNNRGRRKINELLYPFDFEYGSKLPSQIRPVRSNVYFYGNDGIDYHTGFCVGQFDENRSYLNSIGNPSVFVGKRELSE